MVDRREHADSLAGSAGLARKVLRTDTFILTSYARIKDPQAPIHVYIEGDGLAWTSRTTVSPDPTPRNALSLALAAKDPAANVVYVARPCQFTDMSLDALCEADYWTGKRFSEKVIVAVNQVVGHFARKAPGRPIHLFGYSGGGAVAALVAARRPDVASLTTIAGNLDIDTFVQIHDVTPMTGSLNPAGVAGQLAALPQRHFVGKDDDVVPVDVVNGFVAAASDRRCMRVVPISGASHETGWEERWPSLLRESFGCEGT